MSDEELKVLIQQIRSGETDGVLVISELARMRDMQSIKQISRAMLEAEFGPDADACLGALEKALRQALETGEVGLVDDSMLPGYRPSRPN